MKYYLSMFCLINVFTVVKSAQLDITPSTNIQAGEPTLTVRCQPTSSVQSVVQLDISRKREGESTEMVLGKIENGKKPELGPGLTSPKYTVTGSTDPVSTSFLQIVIQEPNSNDKGEYGCKVKASGGSGITYTSERKHSVNVQGSGGESNRNAGSVVFFLSVALFNLISHYLY